MKGIADTGLLVAFISANDTYHDWAVSLVEEQNEPFLTCEAVLAETAFQLKSSETALALIEQGLVTLDFDCSEHLLQLQALAKRYADRHPGLADLCLIRMSELHPRHTVITVDEEDFSIYRRNKRDAIPIICPPRK